MALIQMWGLLMVKSVLLAITKFVQRLVLTGKVFILRGKILMDLGQRKLGSWESLPYAIKINQDGQEIFKVQIYVYQTN